MLTIFLTAVVCLSFFVLGYRACERRAEDKRDAGYWSNR